MGARVLRHRAHDLAKGNGCAWIENDLQAVRIGEEAAHFVCHHLRKGRFGEGRQGCLQLAWSKFPHLFGTHACGAARKINERVEATKVAQGEGGGKDRAREGRSLRGLGIFQITSNDAANGERAVQTADLFEPDVERVDLDALAFFVPFRRDVFADGQFIKAQLRHQHVEQWMGEQGLGDFQLFDLGGQQSGDGKAFALHARLEGFQADLVGHGVLVGEILDCDVIAFRRNLHGFCRCGLLTLDAAQEEGFHIGIVGKFEIFERDPPEREVDRRRADIGQAREGGLVHALAAEVRHAQTVDVERNRLALKIAFGNGAGQFDGAIF